MRGGGADQGGTKSQLIWSSVRKLHTADGKLDGQVPAEQELEELDKFDIETITGLVDARSPGPDLAIEMECPRDACGFKNRQALDWTYDGFFSISGRSNHSTS